jgi:ribosomal protein S18 acetylase RimI-like enzyme
VDIHLAQINIGTMIAPVDDPAVAEFMDGLDRINAQADTAPGFVWRLQTEDGNATSIHIFPNPLQLVNMSVWESAESLKDYVYRTDHVDFFRRRAMWFEADVKRVALWWIPAGTVPDLTDAVRRVEFLERHGSSPYAFGFAHPPKPLLIESTTLDDPSIADLFSRLDHESNEMDPESVVGPRGTIVRATYDGRAVACGAIRVIDDDTAEVTRLLVDPSVRDLKIGEAVLDQLEQHAQRRGCERVRFLRT